MICSHSSGSVFSGETHLIYFSNISSLIIMSDTKQTISTAKNCTDSCGDVLKLFSFTDLGHIVSAS